MLSPLNRFLLSLFGIFLLMFVIANLYLYVYGENPITHQQYYFGFTSFMNWLKSFEKLPSIDRESVLFMPTILRDLKDNTIGVFEGLSSLDTGNPREVLLGIQKILTLLTLPIPLFKTIMLMLASIVSDVVIILYNFFNLLTGVYNQPFTPVNYPLT